MDRGDLVGPVAGHSAGTITYANRECCDLVGVEVADTGVPDTNREVTRTGTQTPLRHTNSIGLRVIDWSVTAFCGSLDLSPNHPHGSVLTVQVPVEAASAERSGSRGPAA